MDFMKRQKLVFIMILVSLLFVNSSVFSENNNIFTNHCSIDSKATLIKNVLKIFHHFQMNNGQGLEVVLNKNVIWEYEGVEGIVPFAGCYSGKKGIEVFWKNFFKSITVLQFNLRYYIIDGNKIHIHWTEEGIVKSTGKRYIMETVQRWEFNNKGELIKFRWYNDTFALYQAFQPNTDPLLSIAQHPADYNINGDGPIDALPIVQQFYQYLLDKNLPSLISKVSMNNVFILAAPESIVPHAGTRYGPQGIIDFFTILNSTQQFISLYPLTYTVDGCRVDVEFIEELLVYATGKIVKNRGIHSIVVNSNGQLAKFRSYNNTYINAWGSTK